MTGNCWKKNVYLNLVKRKDYLLCQSLIQLDYFFVGGGKYTNLPSCLDPTLVKAMCMRESRCCITQQQQDIMQVNNEGDWVKGKEQVGLKKD